MHVPRLPRVMICDKIPISNHMIAFEPRFFKNLGLAGFLRGQNGERNSIDEIAYLDRKLYSHYYSLE